MAIIISDRVNVDVFRVVQMRNDVKRQNGQWLLVYAYKTKIYDGWNDMTKNQVLHPFAWIEVFKAYKLMD